MSPQDQREYGAQVLHELRAYGYVLDDEADRPAGPYAPVVSAFEELERFVESRLRRE